MPNINHVDILDADRHQPKGASTALVKQVLTSNGDGTTYFGYPNYNDITGKPTIKGYQQILYGASAASNQNPTAVNTALQVEFGAAQSLTDVSLSSAGLLTFLKEGQYLIELSYRFGRTAATGSAVLFSRALVNGTQILASSSATLVDTALVIPVTHTIALSPAVNDTFVLQVIRDSAGLNNGGLTQTTPNAAGWNTSPSANLTVYKYIGPN